MSSLHPHWQSTNDDDASASSSPPPIQKSAPTRVDIVPASRLPAALVGIVVVTVVGITLAGAWKPLLAQVTGSEQTPAAPVSATTTSSKPAAALAVEIHITKDGFSPASVVVQPGQKITWINDQTIPHILTSATLRNQSGSYLNTPAIFPKGKGSFTVGLREPDREHTYGSTTDKKLIGTIIVSKTGQAPAATDPCTANGGTGLFGGLDDINLPTGRGTTGDCLPSSSSSSSSAPAVVVPVSSSSVSSASSVSSLNPAAPAIPDGTPITNLPEQPTFPAAPVGDVTGTVVAENNYAPATPEPQGQPETGPALWIVSIVSIGALAFFTRKHFKKI
jgi:plastocyanin